MGNTRGTRSGAVCWILPSLVALISLAACSKKDPEATLPLGKSGGGGTFSLRTPVGIEVPPGALSVPTTLTATQRLAGPIGTVGPVFDFGPDGTQFRRPVTLRLNLKGNEALAGLLGARLSWARLEKSGRLKLLPTRVRPDGFIEAETSSFSPYGFVTECRAAGTGTSFALACPAFGDPTIQSVLPLTIEAQAGPVALIIRIKGTGGSTSLKIGRLRPGHVYFRYVDGFDQGTPQAADASGEVTFPQDLLQDHVVILQTHPASLNLTAANCASVGTFDAATSTCTLTTDIPTSVSIGQSGLILDCASRRLGTPTELSSVGLMVVNRTDVKVRNCRIFNAQVAFMASACTRPVVEATTATMPAGAEGGTAFFLPDGTGAILDGVTAEGYVEGIEARNGQNLVARNVTLRPSFLGMDLNGYAGATLEDFKIDSSFVTPARAPLVGLLIENGSTAQVTRFDGSNLTGFSFGIQVASSTGADAVAVVKRATVSGAGSGVVFVASTSGSELSESTIGPNGTGLEVGGPHVVFHNNIFGNSTRQVFAHGPVELSDTRPASPTSGHGNFWGGACPGVLFQPGTDSNRADAVDSHPYGQASAWVDGGVPGCGPVLAAPVLTSPTDGGYVSTGSPTFRGTSVAFSTIELLEAGVVRGAGPANGLGNFSITPSAPLPDGVHLVAARAKLNGSVSHVSNFVAFTVDTAAPAPPSITLPAAGATLHEPLVVVSGIAEAGTTVFVREGTAFVGSARAGPNGLFQTTVRLSAGPHSVAALAEDSAGNASAPSVPVSFNVAVLSPTAPMLGALGKMQITSVVEGLDPFVPSRGEKYTLQIGGQVLHPGNYNCGPGNGANGSGGGTGSGNGNGQKCTLEVRIQQEVRSSSRSALVATYATSTPPISLLGSGNSAGVFSVNLEYDGTVTGGGFASEGAYLLAVKGLLVRNPPPRGTPLPPGFPECGPVALPFDPRSCILDEFELLTTFGLLEDYLKPKPGPGGLSPVPEICNGIDDDGDGAIDERGVCDVFCAPAN